MFIHNLFVYLHLIKTGGWTIRRAFERAGYGSAHPDRHQHLGIRDLDPDLVGSKLMFSSMRELCAWYRSYIHYNLHADGTVKPIFSYLGLTGAPELKEVLAVLLFPADHGVIKPVEVLGIGERMPAELPYGLYTWCVFRTLAHHTPMTAEHLADDLAVDLLVDIEALPGVLVDVVERSGMKVGCCEKRALQTAHSDNTMDSRLGAKQYERPLERDFDTEMVRWVYQRDSGIADLMGYTGPGCTGHAELWARAKAPQD